MKDRGSVANLVINLVAWCVFMALVLTALGFGIGQLELAICVVLFCFGCALIVRRFRRARSTA